MDCEIRQHLTAYLDGELSVPLRTKVAEHLGQCPRCARELEELRLTRSLLERWAVPDPAPEARARAWQALRRDGGGVPERVGAGPGWFRPVVRYALPVAAVALVAVLATLFLKTAFREREGPLAVPDEVIAELPVLENLEMLEALDVLTEWENLQALAALEPTLLPGNAEEVTP